MNEIIIKGLLEFILVLVALILVCIFCYREGVEDGYKKCRENNKELESSKDTKVNFIDAD